MKLVKPKKFLGQHFLKDLQIAKDIADTVDACPDLPVLEVGPGMGVLTQFLIPKERPVKVVELDFESVAYLKENFAQLGDNIIEQLHGYDTKRSGRTYSRRSRKQDIRNIERADTGMVSCGIPIYSSRKRIQPSAKGKECGNTYDKKRDYGLGVQRKVVQANSENHIQPAP